MDDVVVAVDVVLVDMVAGNTVVGDTIDDHIHFGTIIGQTSIINPERLLFYGVASPSRSAHPCRKSLQPSSSPAIVGK